MCLKIILSGRHHYSHFAETEVQLPKVTKYTKFGGRAFEELNTVWVPLGTSNRRGSVGSIVKLGYLRPGEVPLPLEFAGNTSGQHLPVGCIRWRLPPIGLHLPQGSQSGRREGLDQGPVPGATFVMLMCVCTCMCVSQREGRSLGTLQQLLRAFCRSAHTNHPLHSSQYCSATRHRHTRPA